MVTSLILSLRTLWCNVKTANCIVTKLLCSKRNATLLGVRTALSFSLSMDGDGQFCPWAWANGH